MDRVDLPKKLKKNIILLIQKEEYAYARKYVLMASMLGIISFIGGAFSLRYVFQGFVQSSFYSYASLLFSDPDILLQFWREFGLSLVETIPLFEITTLLVTIAILLLSIRILANNLHTRFFPGFSH